MLSTDGFEVELVDREDGLGQVADSWRRLAAQRGNAFVTPEWYSAAISTLHRESSPAVAVIRETDGRIRGLMPMLSARPRGAPRLLSFPATRYGDLYHPVAAEGDDERIAAAAAPILAQHLGRRCQLDVGRVDAAAGWWRELARAWPGPMTAVQRPVEALPYIELDGSSWEDYLSERSRGFRSQVGRKMRGLRRDHRVRLRRPASEQEVLGDLDTLFELHEARWAGRQVASAIADPGAREFHRRFMLEASRHRWLRLYLLEVDSEPVAGWYGWRVGDRFAYYQAGFDPAWGRYSVGFLLLAETVREAIAEGAAEYDLLLGDEPFKARFATAQRLGRSVLLAPPFSRPRLRATARAWLTRLRSRTTPRRGG
jgi:CelD/BcsL family acetyltransferase involved in cellulose biosynthesis